MRKCLGLLLIMIALFMKDLPVVVSLSHNMQKLALFQIKLSLATNSTASAFCDKNLLIPSYSKMMNWSMSSDCCTWDGVTCNERTGDVIGLDMRCSQLVGPIFPNSSLFQLSHLQSLNLDFNDLHGVLPEGIFHLPNLKELSLRYNLNLTVSLPKTKWGCSGSLQTLFIEQTSLSGEIPDSIRYLKSLTTLELLDGNFSGTISRSIGNLTQLTSLFFANNYFSGAIPDSLGNLQNLTQLTISGSKLIGQIPSLVANLKQLETLYLSDNLLTDEFPSWVANLKQLKTLYLSDNLLTGLLP
ncbi:receptor-like protein 35 [Daucus carota subsp. sativus]|uniref:receptor-like protein 35 n=1 Tax=Daucus carota subsp. sativus TaxID=79200 RepID=UPI0007EF9FDC|nr:PREDICTED: probable leucine-rich repeat receptor-like protein kinase At1g35710 [Daucus carota subsp. sativus]